MVSAGLEIKDLIDDAHKCIPGDLSNVIQQHTLSNEIKPVTTVLNSAEDGVVNWFKGAGRTITDIL